jgi:hypothetical protein
VLLNKRLLPLSSPVSDSPLSGTCSGGNALRGSTLRGNPCPRCGRTMSRTSCASGEQLRALLRELMEKEYGNLK